MKIPECVTRFFNCQRMNLKKNTIRNYEFFIGNFQEHFGDTDFSSINSEGITELMSKISMEPDRKQRIRDLLSFRPFSIP
jgi:hypothetical protein